MRKIKLYGLCQCRGPVFIMCAIQDEQRIFAHNAEPARPFCFQKPSPQCLIRYGKSRRKKRLGHFHRQSRIGCLMLSCQRNFQILMPPVSKTLFCQTVFHIRNAAYLGNPQRTATLFRFLPNNPHRLFFLSAGYDRTILFDDAGLLPRDFLKRAAKRSHMVHADRRQYRTDGRPDKVRRIRQSSHSGLKHDNITFFIQKIQKSKRRIHLKLRRVGQSFRRHLLRRRFHLFQIQAELILRNHFPVYLKTLPVIRKRR